MCSCTSQPRLSWIPAFQAVSKRQLRSVKGQSVIPAPSVIPAKAGIQGSWRGPYAAFPRSHPAWIPAFAGMTISGALASLGWCFDTACFAGMTIRGVVASLGWCFDTPAFAGMTASGFHCPYSHAFSPNPLPAPLREASSMPRFDRTPDPVQAGSCSASAISQPE